MRWPRRLFGGVALTAGMLCLGCSDGDGGDTPTNELIPDFRVISNPNTTQAYARLTSQSVPSIRLPDGQQLRVTAGAQSKVMGFAQDPVNGAFYTTSLLAPATDEAIVFTLDRGGGGDATSQVTMPAPVNLTAPRVDSVVTVGTNLTVSWTPSGTADEITIVLTTTECSGGGSSAPRGVAIAGDPGTATIAVPPSILPIDLPFGGSCAVSLRVERTRFGTVDVAFAPGGTVVARRLDFRRIYVIPE